MGLKEDVQIDAPINALEQTRSILAVLHRITALERSFGELKSEVHELMQLIKGIVVEQQLGAIGGAKALDPPDLVASKSGALFVLLPDPPDPELRKVLPTSLASIACFPYASMKQIWGVNGNINLDLPDTAVFREGFIEVGRLSPLFVILLHPLCRSAFGEDNSF
ncbi:hypothetical protein Sjap_022572 [Stephania japonica]|uniref:Uncharacterized protein n=1 Tax=Stephania japonica TaxID=461633 RepID=A0AAP0EP50_9MAGN